MGEGKRGRGIVNVDFHQTPTSRPFNPAISFTRDANGYLSAFVKTDADDGAVYTSEVTRNANNQVTAMGAWSKS